MRTLLPWGKLTPQEKPSTSAVGLLPCHHLRVAQIVRMIMDHPDRILTNWVWLLEVPSIDPRNYIIGAKRCQAVQLFWLRLDDVIYLVILLMIQKSGEKTTERMVLKPSKQWDQLLILLVSQISEPSTVLHIPSRELTCPPKMAF